MYVADRENRRVQIFDVDGSFIKSWKFAGLPCGLLIGPDQQMYLATGFSGQILRLDANGKAVGDDGPARQRRSANSAKRTTWRFAPSGDIYVADTINAVAAPVRETVKFTPRAEEAIRRSAGSARAAPAISGQKPAPVSREIQRAEPGALRRGRREGPGVRQDAGGHASADHGRGSAARAFGPWPGDVAVDCTLGGGGHARAILERVQPGGRLIGLDVDPIELPRTEARLRAAGFGPETFTAHHANFAGLPQALAAEGLGGRGS